MKQFYEKLLKSSPAPERLFKVKLNLAIWSFIGGLFFAAAGMAIYPYGVIDATVLIMVAQLLVLCATLLGKNITLDLEHKYFHTEDQMKKFNDNEEKTDENKQVQENGG